MKIVLTSDLHGNLPDIEPCDVLVIAGDICPDAPVGKRERYKLPDNGAGWQAEWLREEFVPWLEDLAPRVGRVLAIWGNHDFVGEPKRFGVTPPYMEDLVTFLHDEEIVIDGVKFYGTPWVPGLPRWAFYGSENALDARAAAIPRDTDILISHGPPYGTADFVDPQYGSLHVGDRALTRALEDDLHVPLLVCGHIHEQYGKHEIDHGDDRRQLVWNVSHVNTSYEPVNEPMVLNIERFD